MSKPNKELRKQLKNILNGMNKWSRSHLLDPKQQNDFMINEPNNDQGRPTYIKYEGIAEAIELILALIETSNKEAVLESEAIYQAILKKQFNIMKILEDSITELQKVNNSLRKKQP